MKEENASTKTTKAFSRIATKLGMRVCVRSALLVDGTIVGEAYFHGTQADCESVLADEDPMTGIDRNQIAEEFWKMTTWSHWEALQLGKA